MPTEIKICGLSDEESLDAAIAGGADYLGFVFFPRSPRNLTIERAVPLMRRASGKAARVALLVDPDRQLLDAVVCTLDPEFLQLHGGESPDRVAAIRAEYDTPVIKAVGISSAADLDSAAQYADVADRILFDSKPAADASRPGGNGVPFDWTLLEKFSLARPWFLSGGLGPENVATALNASRAAGVDVSSGVETSPGRKSPALIQAFIAAVRDAERPLRRLAG